MFGRRYRLKGTFLAGGLGLGHIPIVPQLALSNHPVETTRFENDKFDVPDALNCRVELPSCIVPFSVNGEQPHERSCAGAYPKNNTEETSTFRST